MLPSVWRRKEVEQAALNFLPWNSMDVQNYYRVDTEAHHHVVDRVKERGVEFVKCVDATPMGSL